MPTLRCTVVEVVNQALCLMWAKPEFADGHDVLGLMTVVRIVLYVLMSSRCLGCDGLPEN